MPVTERPTERTDPSLVTPTGRNGFITGEVAALLGVSKSTVVRLARQGLLLAFPSRPGGWRRFHPEDVRLYGVEHDPDASAAERRRAREWRVELHRRALGRVPEWARDDPPARDR